MSATVVARLLRWDRPSVHRPGYSPQHVEVSLGKPVTRLGDGRTPVIVGKVTSVRETPAGLEATITMRDTPEALETASEMADGYLPAVDVALQQLTQDARTFRPRARVLGLQLGTLADPSGDQGRVLTVNGAPVPSPDPDVAATPVRPVKPSGLIEAEDMLTEAGHSSSWWANTR